MLTANPVILLADDDDDDHLLVRDALKLVAPAAVLLRVRDGRELMAYLRHCGPTAAFPAARAGGARPPRPALLIVDLNMPDIDGRDVIQEIKADPWLRRLPLVVLTTSRAPEDVNRSYDLGVNSYIRKPASYHEFIDAIRNLYQYWFTTVELPGFEPVSARCA